MKTFTGFLKKELIHIFRDTRTLVILFGLPVAQILIFGFVIRNELQDVKIAIVDHSNDRVTREITSRLVASGFFRIDEILASENEADEVFKRGRVRMVVVFGDRFSERLERENKADMQLLTDASDPNSASLIVNYVRGIVVAYLRESGQGEGIPSFAEPLVRMMYNTDLRSSFMFVPGTIAMVLLLVSAMMTSISIAREKETGTMEALLVSPIRPVVIIAGKVTPYIVLSFINGIVILLLGHFVFGLPVSGSLALLLAETILFISLSLSLGILISTLSSTQQVAMFVSAFALMLPTILLSGFIFPIENMPKILQWLSAAMPPKYFIAIVRSIMLKGTGLAEIWDETLILVSMTVLFLVLSAVRFKQRLG